MNAALLVLAAVMLASAALAFALRNLIYSALLLILTWAGVAAVYLWAGAEFVAFAQLLIYVGAISMVVLFAVLLTRRAPQEHGPAAGSFARAAAGIMVGGAVAAVLAGAIVGTRLELPAGRPPAASVRQLGFQLMNTHAASLLIVGVVLTAALIGATILASSDDEGASRSRRERSLLPSGPEGGDA